MQATQPHTNVNMRSLWGEKNNIFLVTPFFFFSFRRGPAFCLYVSQIKEQEGKKKRTLITLPSLIKRGHINWERRDGREEETKR